MHGDIKPANLLVVEGRLLKILDFGLARFESDHGPPPVVRGTPNYMAPEQVRGGAQDHRIDIFAAGAVMYEAVALQQAFPGGIGDGVLNSITADGPGRLAERAPHVAPELARIVDRALERAPERRYRSIDEMRRDIAAVRHRPLSATESPPREVDRPAPGPPGAAPAVGPPRQDLLDQIIASTGGRDGQGSHDEVAVFTRDVSVAGEAAVRPIDDVQFTLYRPKAVRPRAPYPMLVFTHRGDRPPDAPDAPLPIERVRRRAGELLGPNARLFRDTTTDAKHAVPAYGEITLVPRVNGIDFTPERHTFRWVSDVHEHRFDRAPDPAPFAPLTPIAPLPLLPR